MNMQYRLERYLIHSVAVINNDDYDAKKPSHTGDSEVSIGIAEKKNDSTRRMVTLEIHVKPTKGREDCFFPYRIAIKGSAFFRFRTEYSKSETDHFLRLNGASILYGLLRGQVAQITAQGTHGQFLLPIFNFVEAEKKAGKAVAGKRTKTAKK